MCNVNPIEGRYSFSLSTFDPDGKIGQLSYATFAAARGSPVLTVQNGKYRVMFSLQVLPSILLEDDGSARFIKITDTILLAHTGIAADGRIVCEAAQRLAVEHAYTFQEEIPINILLEELALLFQSYTMKPGVRPFGCSLIISSTEGTYRIDPTGVVVKLDKISYWGRGDQDSILSLIKDKFSEQSNDHYIPMNELVPMVTGFFQRKIKEGETRAIRSKVESEPLAVSVLCVGIDEQGKTFFGKYSI